MNNDISKEQREEITSLIQRMRKVAAKVGSMHSWWDVIFDMEAFLEDRKTIVKYSADGWIKYANDLLSKTEKPIDLEFIKRNVTSEQINEYITYAQLEAGPNCEDEWFNYINELLRSIHNK